MITQTMSTEEAVSMTIIDLEEEVRAQEKEIEIKRGVIERLRKLLPPDEEHDEGNDERPAATKPRRKKPAAEPAASGNGKPAGDSRERIRQLLGKEEALTAKEIAAKTGIANHNVSYSLRSHPWFEQVDPDNRRSPWQLTEAGRAGT